MDLFLGTMARKNIYPNFWCSREYLKHLGAEQINCGYWRWIECDGAIMFPPLQIKDFSDSPPIYKTNYSFYMEAVTNFVKNTASQDIFASFFDFEYPSANFQKKFLDYNFIYNPADFKSMKGKKWSKFRKNSRKWFKRFGQKSNYININRHGIVKDHRDWEKKIDNLLISYLEKLGTDTIIHDPDTLFAFVHKGENRSILINEDKVVGLNVWDYNHQYINYRYVITRPEPYLDEYMRFCFYIDMANNNPGMLVNDGGVLDNENLYKFKVSLNPIFIKKVYSWSLNNALT